MPQRGYKTCADLMLFFEAWFLLLFWKIISSLLPLRFYAKRLGLHQQHSREILIENPMIVRILRAVARGKKYTPWRIKCLAEAITAQQMLRRRKIPSTLYLGIAKQHNQEMTAHAWLRCGDRILTGRRGMNKFTVVSSFAWIPESMKSN